MTPSSSAGEQGEEAERLAGLGAMCFWGCHVALACPSTALRGAQHQHFHVQGVWPAAVWCARVCGKGKPADPHQIALGKEGVCATPAEEESSAKGP